MYNSYGGSLSAFGAEPLPDPVLTYCKLDHAAQNLFTFRSNTNSSFIDHAIKNFFLKWWPVSPSMWWTSLISMWRWRQLTYGAIYPREIYIYICVCVCVCVPSHYLNQCWNIVDSNLRNKLQWNPRRNSFIFILENAFENVVCEMASIRSRSQWVNINS